MAQELVCKMHKNGSCGEKGEKIVDGRLQVGWIPKNNGEVRGSVWRTIRL